MEAYIYRAAVSHDRDMMTESVEVYRDYEHVYTVVGPEVPCPGNLVRKIQQMLAHSEYGVQRELF